MHDAELVYDIGMHRGEDTEYYLKKGFRVVAFEANPQLVEFCKKKFAEQITSGKLTIINGAIAPQHHGDRITFYRNSLSEWGTIEIPRNDLNFKRGSSSEIIEVDRINLTEILHRYGVPFF
jgi:FkbM family methyltransferase